MTLKRHQRDWDDLGKVDALWAIYTDPSRRMGRWDLADFFATGARDVERTLSVADEVGHPKARSVALDFGCGVGRLTRALAPHFDRCYGVDISSTMIEQARELNREVYNCEFLVNETDRMAGFDDASVDLILTQWVLQHLPGRDLVRSYLLDFLRVLRPGGLLVCQLRTALTLKHRLQLGRRIYAPLRAAGLSERLLYTRLRVNPMRVTAIPRADIDGLFDAAGATVLRVDGYTVASGSAATYYVTP